MEILFNREWNRKRKKSKTICSRVRNVFENLTKMQIICLWQVSIRIANQISNLASQFGRVEIITIFELKFVRMP